MPRYTPKLPLWPHQKSAIKNMYGKKFYALFLAMRQGKTPTILAEFGQMELDGKAKDFMVIAPAGVYKTWIDAMKSHFSDDLRERIMVHLWQSGSGTRVERDRKAFLTLKEPRALLMNIEAISRPGEARDFCKKFLDQRTNIVVIDEATRIKNPTAKRTKFIIKVIKPLADYRRILSGLPTPRSPLDLFSQMEFLDAKILGWNSWHAFRAHVAYMKVQWFGDRQVQLIDKEQGNNGFKPEAIKELQRLIKPHSYRVEFRPKVPTTYEIREVEMTKEQEKAYREMKEHCTTMLSNQAHITATVVIAQLMRMHQILCGHSGDEEGNVQIIPENKTAALLELLEDYGGKAIIWCSYDLDIRKVAAALIEEYGEGSVARFWGGNVKTREAEVNAFKTKPECRFIVATPDSGGMGQTWDMADLTVYYSSKDNLEHRDQSEQRAMGRDKAHGVDVVDLIHPGTVEVKILEALRKKINMSSQITNDSWREWVV